MSTKPFSSSSKRTGAVWRGTGRHSRARPGNALVRVCAVALWVSAGYHESAQAACAGEAERSRASAVKIEQEWPLRPAQDAATRYLQTLGERLIAAGIPPERKGGYDWPEDVWRFALVRDLSPNAFSIGNGRVYVTDGSIAFAASEAELAAILAHEIAHQLAGHFCAASRSDANGNRQIGSLVQALDNAKEMQADLMALNILRSAGFPANAMLEVVERLPLSEDGRQRQQRIEALLHNLRAAGDTPNVPPSREFDAVKEGPR